MLTLNSQGKEDDSENGADVLESPRSRVTRRSDDSVSRHTKTSIDLQLFAPFVWRLESRENFELKTERGHLRTRPVRGLGTRIVHACARCAPNIVFCSWRARLSMPGRYSRYGYATSYHHPWPNRVSDDTRGSSPISCREGHELRKRIFEN